jgi:hypothetical protein
MPLRRLLRTLAAAHLGHRRAHHVELKRPVGVAPARIHRPARGWTAAVRAAGTSSHLSGDVLHDAAQTADDGRHHPAAVPPGFRSAHPARPRAIFLLPLALLAWYGHQGASLFALVAPSAKTWVRRGKLREALSISGGRIAPSVQSPPLAAARFALRRSLSASARLLGLAPGYRLTRTVRDDPQAALTPNPSRSVPESVSADSYSP